MPRSDTTSFETAFRLQVTATLAFGSVSTSTNGKAVERAHIRNNWGLYVNIRPNMLIL